MANENKSITQYVEEAHQNAVNKGWWDEPRSVAECIALIHSEASEALEDIRNGKRPDEEWYEGNRDAIDYESDEDGIVSSVIMVNADGSRGIASSQINSCWKPCGVPSELADIIIRVFDLAGRYNIDLERAIDEKMAYNATRPARHGGKVL